MNRSLPVLVLFLALPSSFPLHAKEAPTHWKSQIRKGVAAWDAGKAEEAEEILEAAVKTRIKSLPPDTDLALAQQILSQICETRGKTKKDRANGKTEADKHFQKAKNILDKAWAAGAGKESLEAFRARATELETKHRFAEQASLRHLVLGVLEVRAPGTLLLAQAYLDCAVAASNLGHFLEAEGLWRQLIALTKKVGNSQDVDAARNDLARCYADQGRYREAVDLFQSIIMKDTGPADPRGLGITLVDCAKALVRLGDEASADAMLQRALPPLLKAVQKEMDEEARLRNASSQRFREELAHLMTLWGDLRRSQGRFEEAHAFYTRALKTIPLTDTELSQAALFQVQGRFQEAERVAREVLKFLEQNFEAGHFSVASARMRLASICFAEGKNKEAESLLRKALRVQEEVLSLQHPDTAETADILGTLLYVQSRYPEAETLFEDALEGRIMAFGEDHALVSETLGHQGDLYMAMSRFKDAEAPYRKALLLDEKRLGENHPGVGLRCRRLGQCLITQTRIEEAEPFLSRALRIDEAVFGADNPVLEQDLNSLSQLFKATGDSKKQEEMSQRLETGRAKAAEESPKPTAPAEPLSEVPATPEGLQEALRRGLGFMGEARGAPSLDFDTKRRAYTSAEVAFRQAMKALEAMKAVGNGPDDADEQNARIRSFLFECHKCKPL